MSESSSRSYSFLRPQQSSSSCLLLFVIICSLSLLDRADATLTATLPSHDEARGYHHYPNLLKKSSSGRSNINHRHPPFYPEQNNNIQDDIPATANRLAGRRKVTAWHHHGGSSRRRSRTVHCSFIDSLQIMAQEVKTASPTALRLKCKSFDEMILNHHSTPILIDFYAPWCGPCKLMKTELSSIRPQLEKLGPRQVLLPIVDGDSKMEENDGAVEVESASSESKERIQQQPTTGIPVFHVDTNKFPQVGAKNKIHGLPTLVLFFEGSEIWRNEGIIMGGDIMDVLAGLQEEGWTTTTTANGDDDR